MDDQEFKDTLAEWAHSLCDAERNAAIHTANRETRIITSIEVEHAEMLAYVDALKADAALGAMVRQLPIGAVLEHEEPTSLFAWSVWSRRPGSLYTGKTAEGALSNALANGLKAEEPQP